MCVHMEHTHMHTDACSDGLPFSYASQRELCLNKHYDVSFPARMLGSEQQLPENFYSGECLSTL